MKRTSQNTYPPNRIIDGKDVYLLEPYNDAVINFLIEKHLIKSQDDIRLYTQIDLDDMGNFADYHLVVIQGKLLKVMSFEDKFFVDEFTLNEIDDITIETMVSSGNLYIKKDDNLKLLCRYSISKSKYIRIFCDLFKKAIDHSLTDDEIRDSQILDIGPTHCPKCKTRYADSNRQVCPKCMKKGKIFVRLLKYTANYKWSVAFIIGVILLSCLVNVIIPYFTGSFLYDEVLTQEGRFFGKVWLFIGVIFGLKLANFLLYVALYRRNGTISAFITYDIKKDIFSSMQKLSMKFFTSRQTGELMTNVNTDATNIQNFLTNTFPYLFTCIMQIIGIFILLWHQNRTLTLLIVIPFPIGFIMLKNFLPWLWGKYDKRYNKRSAMTSMISDVFSGMRVVKAFAGEKAEIDKFNDKVTDLAISDKSVNNASQTFFPILNFILNFSIYLIWFFGGLMVINSTGNLPALSYGQLATFIASTSLIYGPLQFLTESIYIWSDCINSANRIFEIMDTKPDIKEPENPQPLDNFSGSVEFKNVNFAYDINKPILKDVSFKVNPGQTLGIVGKTGSGKTTIVNLLMRLYDAGSGNIYIDGHNIKNVSIKQLRKNIAMVSQDIYLFRGTIAQNIAYSRDDIKTVDIINAAKAANAHEFIMSLPDGYETYIGEGGRNLSGGERQRISIARAILHNPKLLILDEATAAMDTKTERLIQESLTSLIKGRTTIMIAHRLSTLRDADNLIVIEDGKVVEEGTHDELIHKKGEYYKLYQIQSEAFKHIGVGD